MVVVVIVLRPHIGVAFSRGVRRLRAGPIEVEFDQELAEVREELSRSPELAGAALQVSRASLAEELARLTEVSPRSAVLEAYARIEAQLIALLGGADVEYRTVRGAALASKARAQELISDETLVAVEGLSILRSLAAHSPSDEIGTERARDYLALADAVLFALRTTSVSRVPSKQ
jgi:hypothetical protein